MEKEGRNRTQRRITKPFLHERFKHFAYFVLEWNEKWFNVERALKNERLSWKFSEWKWENPAAIEKDQNNFDINWKPRRKLAQNLGEVFCVKSQKAGV